MVMVYVLMQLLVVPVMAIILIRQRVNHLKEMEQLNVGKGQVILAKLESVVIMQVLIHLILIVILT